MAKGKTKAAAQAIEMAEEDTGGIAGAPPTEDDGYLRGLRERSPGETIEEPAANGHAKPDFRTHIGAELPDEVLVQAEAARKTGRGNRGCWNCMYGFFPTPDADKPWRGHCRHDPPHVNIVLLPPRIAGGEPGTMTPSSWPVVNPAQFCAKWREIPQ